MSPIGCVVTGRNKLLVCLKCVVSLSTSAARLTVAESLIGRIILARRGSTWLIPLWMQSAQANIAQRPFSTLDGNVPNSGTCCGRMMATRELIFTLASSSEDTTGSLVHLIVASLLSATRQDWKRTCGPNKTALNLEKYSEPNFGVPKASPKYTHAKGYYYNKGERANLLDVKLLVKLPNLPNLPNFTATGNSRAVLHGACQQIRDPRSERIFDPATQRRDRCLQLVNAQNVVRVADAAVIIKHALRVD